MNRPIYKEVIAEAHEFVGDTLGLHVGSVRSASVISDEKAGALAYRCAGDYNSFTRRLFAIAYPDAPDLPGSGRLGLRTTLVHEFTHKGTTSLREWYRHVHRRGAFQSSFVDEAVAGVGEVAFLNSLVDRGELIAPANKEMTYRGRTVMPETRPQFTSTTRDEFWQRELPIPAEFWAGTAELPSLELRACVLEAWTLTLAAEVSGIGIEDILEEARRPWGRPLGLAEKSLITLAPDFKTFVRSQGYESSAHGAIVRHLFDAAVQQGIVSLPQAVGGNPV